MPPVPTTVAVPFVPALQVTLVAPEIVAVTAVGWVMVTDAVFAHELASVMVTVYVPAIKPIAVAVGCEPAFALHI